MPSRHRGCRSDDDCADVVTTTLRRTALNDGDELLIRPACRDDAPAIDEFFESLSFDDRYKRFFSGYRPDAKFIERVASANETGAVELIAIVRHGERAEQVVGEAGAWPLPNGNGELGVTVVPGHRGWLGPYLLDALVEAAAAAGMPNLEAEVLSTNRQMLAVLRARGFAVSGHDGFSSVRIVISTSGSTPSWPPGDSRPRILVELPGTRWDAEGDAEARGLQVIICPGAGGRTGRHPCPALVGQPCPLAAGADAIVVRPGDDNGALPDAHTVLHPGVPVCLQDGSGPMNGAALVDRLLTITRDRGSPR